MSAHVRSVLAATAVATLAWCSGQVTPDVVPGVDGCVQCNMVIDDARQACGWVEDGRFVTFDSPGCLLQRYEVLRKTGSDAPVDVYFADYRDGMLHRAGSVTFLLTDHVPTVMESGVLCFSDRRSAEVTRSHEDELLTDWLGFRTARGEPDRVVRVTFGPDGMTPETVDVDKGELVSWRATAEGLDHDLLVSIEGYPEAGTVAVPASGEAVEFRLMAVRPGAGFPIVRSDGGEALGRLKVSGAHTRDEEAM